MLGFGAKQTTTTTGTGNLTLSSVSGYPTFNQVFGTSRRFFYSILDSNGAPVECGFGYLSSSTVLVRETVYATFASSTYTSTGATAVSLSAGTWTVIASEGPRGATMGFQGFNASAGQKGGCPFPVAGDLTTSGGFTADRLLVVAAWVPVAFDCTGVSFYVSTNVAAKNAVAGLYEANAAGWAGKRIAVTGNQSLAATGRKNVSWSGGNVFLPAGWYFLAFTADDGATVRFHSFDSTSKPALLNPLGSDGTYMLNNWYAYKAIGTTLTLPDPMDAASGFTYPVWNTMAIPAVALIAA